MFQCTQAQIDDIPSLSKLLEILFSQDIEFTPDNEKQQTGLNLIISNNKIGTVYIAKIDNKIIGMVCVLYSVSTVLGDKVGILEDMIIHPDYQGKGFGKQLINYALKCSKENGLKRITLLTDYNNEKAISFYNKNGFNKSTMIPMRKKI